MKRIFLTGVAFAALVAGSGLANAADLRARMPVKAPMMAPIYSWTGFYIGGHIGGAFSEADGVTTVTATNAFSSAGRSRGDDFVGGGTIGYNFQVSPNWVFGIEADVSAGDVRNNYVGVAPGVTVNYDTKMDVFGTVRGRIGYASNNWLFYGTGGYAWADDRFTRTQLTGTTVLATPGTVERGNVTRDGYAAGAGVEWGFAPNWTGKLEYMYYDFDRRAVAFPLSARTTSWDTEIHTVKLGINYKFNFGGMGY